VEEFKVLPQALQRIMPVHEEEVLKGVRDGRDLIALETFLRLGLLQRLHDAIVPPLYENLEEAADEHLLKLVFHEDIAVPDLLHKLVERKARKLGIRREAAIVSLIENLQQELELLGQLEHRYGEDGSLDLVLVDQMEAALNLVLAAAILAGQLRLVLVEVVRYDRGFQEDHLIDQREQLQQDGRLP